MKVTLVVPTLNEIDGMREIMPRVKREWVDQILVIDGQSTDGTVEYAREHGYDVVIQKKMGMRHAYMECMPAVKGDVILTFSPDGNSIPELIPEAIKKYKEGYDMVIVSRYAQGAKSEDDTPVTAFGNWLFSTSISLLHGHRYHDAMVIYRIYRKNLIEELDLDKDESYAFEEKLFNTVVSWEPLLSIRAAKRNLKIAEIPGDEPAREGGVAKLQVLKWGAAYMWQNLREVAVWK